ncbi:MAG: glycosyltransferase family 2 protein [Thermodesulfobacteriota bacterium]
MVIPFWMTAGILVYTYVGYPGLLWLVARLACRSAAPARSRRGQEDLPGVTVVVAALNEERVIGERIKNLLAQDYPQDRLEIVIASDGSTDRTCEVAREVGGPAVRVFDFSKRQGKARVHNEVVPQASHSVVVFTDADTEFDPACVRHLASALADPAVGCVVGNLVYRSRETAVAQAEGAYWRYEKALRRSESRLGLLATATGAVMAVRAECWRDLTPIDDSDFTTPLDVMLQGRRVVQVEEALAYDIPPATARGELRARMRQTSKNLVGTLRRWGVRGWLEHPLASWGLVSHKLLRWCTAFFLVTLLALNLTLVQEGTIFRLFLTAQGLFYLAALAGFVGDGRQLRLPLASPIFSFVLASIGMGIGVIKGCAGRAPATFSTVD